MPQKRTMVFIDGQNLIHAADNYYGERKQLDFVKLVDVLTEGLDLIRPYFFNSHPPDHYPEGWYYFLRREAGFRVISKTLKQRGDEYKEKGVDISLATELIAQGFNDSYDVAVLVSGDDDYDRAIRYVQDQGKVVRAAMFENNASGDLKATVDKFTLLDDIAEQIRDT